MPTAADMAQLGSEIVAGHRTRKREIAGLKATVRAEKKQTNKAMRDVHRANKANKAETVHTLKTQHGAMMREFHGLDKARREGAREHAAQTGHMLGEFQQMDMARQEATREHAAQVQEQMSAYAADNRGAHNEWSRHQKVVAQIRGTARPSASSAARWRARARPERSEPPDG